MIKNALKTFFKSLIYIFVPMGIIYLFFILIVFALMSSVMSSAGDAVSAFVTLVGDTVTSSETVVQDYFVYAFGLIDWNGNFFDVLSEVLGTDWLYSTVVGFLQTMGESVTGFATQTAAIVTNFAERVIASIVASVSVLALAIFFANFITRMVIRRVNARRNFKKKLVAWLLQSTLVVAVLALTVYLCSLWSMSAIFMAIFYVLALSFTSLLSAWIIHGGRRVRFRKVVNVRNLLTYFVSEVIIVLICVAALMLINLLTNAVLTVLIAVPLVVYAANIIDVNADVYVVGMLPESEPEIKAMSA